MKNKNLVKQKISKKRMAYLIQKEFELSEKELNNISAGKQVRKGISPYFLKW
jgi:hypothetical protein